MDEKQRITEQLATKTQRKLDARRSGPQSPWFGLGMFGLVGWSVTVPALLGTALGWWADNRWPGTVSWTITGLFIGLLLGCMTAWRWIRRESDE